MSKAVVFLADGFEECEGLLVVDILRRAGVEVTTASIMENRHILSSHGINLLADVMAKDVQLEDQDMMVLPGGLKGTENLLNSDLVKNAALKMAENKIIAAVCAAPTVFAAAGLLEGKKATCHPSMEGRMQGAVLTYEPVTKDGNIITGRGLGASIPFALELAAVLEGREKADNIAKAICWA